MHFKQNNMKIFKTLNNYLTVYDVNENINNNNNQYLILINISWKAWAHVQYPLLRREYNGW